MPPITLPDGWEHWPLDAKTRLREQLAAAKETRTRQPFYCDRPDCDGEPHGPWRKRHARAAQRPPVGWWDVWLILAGRGFGKTKVGAEWSWRMARRFPRGALVGATAGDVRDTMVEGESGILSSCPPIFRPHYEPSKRRLTYPNGAIQTTFTADAFERIRGPEHHYAWGDEWAMWRFMREATDNLQLGLRLGDSPRLLLTTTPKPRAMLREQLADPDTVVTRGSTYDNLANLPAQFARKITRKYEGTSLGEQELHAELLDDIQGALWNGDLLAAARRPFDPLEVAQQLASVVVAVDPAVTATKDSDETGIVVCGMTPANWCPDCGPIADGPHGYVLQDLSGRYSPHAWASRAVGAYERFDADAIVGEVNNGGDLVGHAVHTIAASARYRDVRASRGKYVRAEPVAALYEQGRVHTAYDLDRLEEQKRTYVPGAKATDDEDGSPDRMDAEVWGLTDLMLDERGGHSSAA